MSFQTFVTQTLAAITERLNAITTNAKKIDELPVQEVINTSSKIHVSRQGISESLAIGQIIEAVANSTFDEVIAVGGTTLTFNASTNIYEILIPAIPIPTWRIGNVYYSKNSETVIELPFAASGKFRFDILLMNTSNEIVVQRGVETSDIAVLPTKLIDTIILYQIYITDSIIGTPTEPFVGDNYIKKIDQGILPIFGGELTEITTDYLFGMYLLYADSLQKITFTTGYLGYRFLVKNATSTPKIIKHGFFTFSNAVDYNVQVGESLEFYYIPGADFCYHIGGTTIELGETSTTAYRGDRGKIAYDKASEIITSGIQFIANSILKLKISWFGGFTILQRNAIASPQEGMLIYVNESPKGFQKYENGAWAQIGSNIFNSDLTLLVNRTHSLNGKTLSFTGGKVKVPALTFETVITADTVVDKVWYDGLKIWLTNKSGINKAVLLDGDIVDASSTQKGLVNLLAQVFKGKKSFLGDVTVTSEDALLTVKNFSTNSTTEETFSVTNVGDGYLSRKLAVGSIPANQVVIDGLNRLISFGGTIILQRSGASLELGKNTTRTVLFHNATEVVRTSGDTFEAKGIKVTGSVEISNGVIMRSPDGTIYRITVANGGVLTTTAITL